MVWGGGRGCGGTAVVEVGGRWPVGFGVNGALNIGASINLGRRAIHVSQTVREVCSCWTAAGARIPVGPGRDRLCICTLRGHSRLAQFGAGLLQFKISTCLV